MLKEGKVVGAITGEDKVVPIYGAGANLDLDNCYPYSDQFSVMYASGIMYAAIFRKYELTSPPLLDFCPFYMKCKDSIGAAGTLFAIQQGEIDMKVLFRNGLKDREQRLVVSYWGDNSGNEF